MYYITKRELEEEIKKKKKEIERLKKEYSKENWKLNEKIIILTKKVFDLENKS